MRAAPIMRSRAPHNAPERISLSGRGSQPSLHVAQVLALLGTVKLRRDTVASSAAEGLRFSGLGLGRLNGRHVSTSRSASNSARLAPALGLSAQPRGLHARRSTRCYRWLRGGFSAHRHGVGSALQGKQNGSQMREHRESPPRSQEPWGGAARQGSVVRNASRGIKQAGQKWRRTDSGLQKHRLLN